MKILISDKKTKETFVSLFHVLKSCSSLINATFELEQLHIQGMDKSHVCLFDVKINKKWFANYEIDEPVNLCVDSNVFHSIISTKSDNQDLIIEMNMTNQDILHITFQSIQPNKNEFKKSFKMPLAEYDYEEMKIPVVDYDAEFTVSSKQISDIFSQLNNFGDDIKINCSEENISLTTNGITGEMRVDIPINDLTSYSIIEDGEITLSYSLSYINKMCITHKLSTEVEFSLSNDCPMKIGYNLGDENYMIFFIAPKMEE